uniref:ATP synthase subunit a n=1 Tax=Falcolipeurus quadripustulatus TaxID=2358485 RepID=A0A386B2B6_9NEOP|nr:ATP synthase F0 subunit 8 [Falcolipeurus quadripustulatus]
MMCSVFSIFDPVCTNPFFEGGFKWISILFAFFLLNWQFYSCLSGLGLIVSKIFSVLVSEIKLVFSAFYKSVILTLISLFYLILLLGLLGMTPFFFTPSSHLLFNLSLSFPLWAMGFIYMFLVSWKGFLSHYVPLGSPMVLVPFLILIEIVSTLIRPFSLSIRLMSNMMAGHLIMSLFEKFLVGLVYSWFIFPLGPLLVGFEYGVAFIQSYVFMTLMSLYWKESI